MGISSQRLKLVDVTQHMFCHIHILTADSSAIFLPNREVYPGPVIRVWRSPGSYDQAKERCPL